MRGLFRVWIIFMVPVRTRLVNFCSYRSDFLLLTTNASPIRMMIPNIPATIVRDENPAEGWVAGCAGTSVVCITTGVCDTVDTACVPDAFTISLKVPCGVSCPITSGTAESLEVAGDGKSPEARRYCGVVRPSAIRFYQCCR